MTTRRSILGFGLLGASFAATGGYIAVRDNGSVRAALGERVRLLGFVGGEKMGFLREPEVVGLLASNGIEIDAKQAGSLEMVSQRPLLDQSPDFLWPSSQPMVDLARRSGVSIRREGVVLNSPIVFYSWENVAAGLEASGVAKRIGERRFSVDTAALLKAVLAKRTWKDLGIDDVFGEARVVSTDPARSNSGYVFSGLAANVLSGGVATEESLGRVRGEVAALFASMGFKTHSSGKLFDDYLSGGPGAVPIAVGYENQLLEWIIADRKRWENVERRAPVKPVILYPAPTVYTAHPLIVLSERADRLLEVLTSPKAQELAWRLNGFRGPFGTFGGDEGDTEVARYVQPSVSSIIPMPDSSVMDTVSDILST